MSSGSDYWPIAIPTLGRSLEPTRGRMGGSYNAKIFGCSSISLTRWTLNLDVIFAKLSNGTITRKRTTGKRWCFGDRTKCIDRRLRR